MVKYVRKIGVQILLLVSYIATVAGATWPWMQRVATHLPDHFDPPFHAAKLDCMADMLLRGHLLPPDGNSHVFYPSPNSAYFDALLLPQAIMSLPLRLVTTNPVLVYNLVHLFSWSLSGYFVMRLLRAVNMPRLSAWVGGALFCVLPYRIWYIVEFNMQQCFGVPLFYLCLLMFVRRPGPARGLGLAFAFVVQATSELYQALFLVLTAAPVALPLVWRRFVPLLVSRRFWIGAAVAVLTAGTLCVLTLRGYLTLAGAAGFSRSRLDMVQHALEPLAYLTDPRVISGLPGLPARIGETPVFPTFIVLALALAHAILDRHVAHAVRATDERRWLLLVRWGRFAAAVACLLTTLTVLLLPLSATNTPLGIMLNLSLVVLCLTSITITCAVRQATRHERLLAGLGLAALFAFLMSIGPTIRVANGHWYTSNWIFSMAERYVPIVAGMRVMSRFSIIVLLYLTVAAAAGFWHLTARRRWATAAAVAVIAIAILEARPRALAFSRPRALPERPSDTTLAATDLLAVIPMGNRWQDAEYMLAFADTDHPLVNGWGGFLPPYQARVGRAFGDADFAHGIGLLQTLYPAPTLVLDLEWIQASWGTANAALEAVAAAGCRNLGGSTRFSLWALPPDATARTDYIRVTRNDVVRRQPHLALVVSAEQRTLADVFLNEAPVASVAVDGQRTVTAYVKLPADYVSDRYANRIRIAGRGGTPLMVTGFDLRPAPPGRPATATVRYYDPQADAVPVLPPGATPCHAEFGSRLALAGYTLGTTACVPGTRIPVTYHWRVPETYSFRRHYSTFLHARDDTGIRFQCDDPLLRGVDPVAIGTQPAPKLFHQRVWLYVPSDTPPGVYDLVFGIYDPLTGNHLRCKSDFPRDDYGVPWQDRITVSNRPEEAAATQRRSAVDGT